MTIASIPEWPAPVVTSWAEQCENTTELEQYAKQYCQDNKLDDEFEKRIVGLYWPMAVWLANQQAQDKPLFVGINGAQGSGKSTLTGLLAILIEAGLDKSVLNLSIDDLYLSKSSRQQMAKDVHPLFATRGVPGTHDVALGIDLFNQIRQGEVGQTLAIPKFDKARDDRVPEAQWGRVQLPIDIVLFEGWCVGAKPQPTDAMAEPVNELEANEDSQGIWRRHANEQLAGAYQGLFNQLDTLIMLKVPSMEQVYQWRQQQENQLAENNRGQKTMGKDELIRFIQHYERLTRYQLEETPARADLLMTLNTNHQVEDVHL